MKSYVLTAVFFLLAILTAKPCGWDVDTIAMERADFPSIHELMVGKFRRHSDAFYYWRIKDREELIQLYPDSLSLYDDLGVANDKIGNHEAAIDAMLAKEALAPGKYETAANLGTFYIHNGEYEEGLIHIKKAIEINPDAHFGREVYQQYVVEYLLSRQEAGKPLTLPLRREGKHFYHFLLERHIRSAVVQGGEEQEELGKAIKGIAGMMRFGNYRSPVLLEVMGDLLSVAKSGNYEAAGFLASRAYLKASFEVKSAESQADYYALAKASRESSYSPELLRFEASDVIPERVRGSHADRMKDLEVAFKLEIQAGEAWFEDVKANELTWIETGVNPDSAYHATYFEAPVSFAYDLTRVTRGKEDQIKDSFWLATQLNAPKPVSYTHLTLPTIA